MKNRKKKQSEYWTTLITHYSVNPFTERYKMNDTKVESMFCIRKYELLKK